MKAALALALVLCVSSLIILAMRSDGNAIADGDDSSSTASNSVALGPWPSWRGSPSLFRTQDPNISPLASLRLSDLDLLPDSLLANRINEVCGYRLYSRLDSGDIGVRGDAVSAKGALTGRLGSIPTGLQSILGLGATGAEVHYVSGTSTFVQSSIPEGVWVCGLNSRDESVVEWFDLSSPIDVGAVRRKQLANFGRGRRVSAICEMTEYLLAFDARNNEFVVAEDPDGDRIFDVFPAGGRLDIEAAGFYFGPIEAFDVVFGHPAPYAHDWLNGAHGVADENLVLVVWDAGKLSVAMR